MILTHPSLSLFFSPPPSPPIPPFLLPFFAFLPFFPFFSIMLSLPLDLSSGEWVGSIVVAVIKSRSPEHVLSPSSLSLLTFFERESHSIMLRDYSGACGGTHLAAVLARHHLSCCGTKSQSQMADMLGCMLICRVSSCNNERNIFFPEKIIYTNR